MLQILTSTTVKPFNLVALKVAECMQKYFVELKPYNSKYCSNFVLFFGMQLIFAPLISRFWFCLARKVREIKGTQT